MIVLNSLAGGHISFLNIATHLINSVQVLIDLSIIGIPHRLLHTWLPVLYAVIFVIFSVAYWGVDDDNVIYEVLDYSGKPVTATVYVLVLVLIGIPLVHLMLFLLYWLRVTVHYKCCGQGDSVDVTPRSEGHANISYVV